MSLLFPDGSLVAYVGDDDPNHDLYRGQPGVVISVGATETEINVALVHGLSLGVPVSELVGVGDAEYRRRAHRMGIGLHPLRDEAIKPLVIGDPRNGPGTVHCH